MPTRNPRHPEKSDPPPLPDEHLPLEAQDPPEVVANRSPIHDPLDLHNEDEIRDWIIALGVSRDALLDAVEAVGTQYAAVREYLGNIRA
jgi:hypothetical protein